MKYSPPFTITEYITVLVGEVCEQAGRVEAVNAKTLSAPHLRMENRIRTIHSTLSIEQNSLTLEQVTAIIEGKRVLGSPCEIREVLNAYDAYQLMLQLDPESIDDLLKAHGLMMNGLVHDAGKFRSGNVGIFDKAGVVHIAPPALLVPEHISNLFEWYRKSGLHVLVKSAVFHYEFEFIHPFSDGNGRLGRMWHSLLLGQWKELFYWLPIEELIQSRQKEYYAELGRADREGECGGFVELMLEIIRDSLMEF